MRPVQVVNDDAGYDDVDDAAAPALEHRAGIVSYDSDFSRFPRYSGTLRTRYCPVERRLPCRPNR